MGTVGDSEIADREQQVYTALDGARRRYASLRQTPAPAARTLSESEARTKLAEVFADQYLGAARLAYLDMHTYGQLAEITRQYGELGIHAGSKLRKADSGQMKEVLRELVADAARLVQQPDTKETFEIMRRHAALLAERGYADGQELQRKE